MKPVKEGIVFKLFHFEDHLYVAEVKNIVKERFLNFLNLIIVLQKAHLRSNLSCTKSSTKKLSNHFSLYLCSIMYFNPIYVT